MTLETLTPPAVLENHLDSPGRQRRFRLASSFPSWASAAGDGVSRSLAFAPVSRYHLAITASACSPPLWTVGSQLLFFFPVFLVWQTAENQSGILSHSRVTNSHLLYGQQAKRSLFDMAVINRCRCIKVELSRRRRPNIHDDCWTLFAVVYG